jgi:hypothetical protein
MHKKVKGEGLITGDAITQISRQNNVQYFLESVLFIKNSNSVGFLSCLYFGVISLHPQDPDTPLHHFSSLPDWNKSTSAIFFL